jgi:hypothetical protein
MKKMSMIEELQAELASRREKVAKCEAKIAQAAERGKIELEAARREVDQYVAKIAEALGLPNPATREAKRLETLKIKRDVRELVKRGIPISQMAEELGLSEEVLLPIVDKVSRKVKPTRSSKENDEPAEGGIPGKPPRLPPEAGQKGWKRKKVLELYLAGKTNGEIADALDITKECVYQHVRLLKIAGDISGDSRPSGGAAAEAPEGDEEAEESEGADQDDDGDTVQDLREEVARQQDGQRTKAARLCTTHHGDHDHSVLVDRMGDGQTMPDQTGHDHKVYRFVVGKNAKHGHGLLAKEPG